MWKNLKGGWVLPLVPPCFLAFVMHSLFLPKLPKQEVGGAHLLRLSSGCVQACPPELYGELINAT